MYDGAVRYCYADISNYWNVVDKIYKYFISKGKCSILVDWNVLVAWNDDKNRTKEEVINLLKELDI